MNNFILLPGEFIELNNNIKECNLLKISEDIYSTNNLGKVLSKDNKLNFEKINTKYYSNLNDQVIGKVIKKIGDYYYININAEKLAILQYLEFSGASKNNRPVLEVDDIIYCKVKLIPKSLPIELSCISKKDKKDWSSKETLYGQIDKGMIFKFSQNFLNILKKNDFYFQKIKKYISIEIIITNNNYLWINLENNYNFIVINSFLKEVENLSIEEGSSIIDNFLEKLQKN